MTQLSYKDYLTELNYSEKNSDNDFSIDSKIVDDENNETLIEIERLEEIIETKSNDLLRLQKHEKQFVSEIEKLFIDETNIIEKNNSLILKINELADKIETRNNTKLEIEDIQNKSIQLKNVIGLKQKEISKNEVLEKKLLSEIYDFKNDINAKDEMKLLYSEMIKLDEERKKLKKNNANIQRKITLKKNEEESTRKSRELTEKRKTERTFGIIFSILSIATLCIIMFNNGEFEEFDGAAIGGGIIVLFAVGGIGYNFGKFIGGFFTPNNK